MGSTILIYKIKPKEDFDTKKVMEDLKKIQKGRCTDAKEIPIGFGIKIVKAVVMVPEKQENIINEVTEEIMKINSVEEAEIEGMTLA
ncbi:MAG: hypothetical protein N3D73_01475 [Candidatus Diapherotrites archaeon]|nr:hypothetical protein [Candidatus Diapherotrites archaeon]